MDADIQKMSEEQLDQEIEVTKSEIAKEEGIRAARQSRQKKARRAKEEKKIDDIRKNIDLL